MKKRNLLVGLLSTAAILGIASCGKQPDKKPDGGDDKPIVIDYGTLTIEDVELTFMNEVVINPVFSIEEYAEEISYEFEGHNISITDGKIKGLVAGTVTEVSAKTEHHEAKFNVTVNALSVTLTKADGGESKAALPTPDNEDTYVLHCVVKATKIINDYTRLSSFAYNGSDNSWYNIEMGGDGNLTLFGHFNGVEKYWIPLGNKADLMVDGVLTYKVDLVRNGQETFFYFNDKLACWFNERDMQGYAELGSVEVTAAADRAGAGEYIINLENVSYELEDSNAYKAHVANLYKEYADETLASDNGAEQHHTLVQTPTKMVLKTRVTVNVDSTGWFRPSAFAFNKSDNSWYNIETGADGAVTLFARFNGVEKYFIGLGNKADSMVDGKFSYEVVILREGQASYFFYNGELKCSFSETEVATYPGMTNMDITSCADRAGSAFEVKYSEMKVEDENSATFKTYKAKVSE